MKRVKGFLELYIEHRERFEKKIKNSYPFIYLVRRFGTFALRALRDTLNELNET